MTPPSRSKPKTTAALPVTLSQFSDQLDRDLGRRAEFASTVRELYVTRTQLAYLREARRPLFERIVAGYDDGHRIVTGSGYELRCTAAGVPMVYRAVDSAAAKKADKVAWAAAAVEVPYVSAKAPGLVDEQFRAALSEWNLNGLTDFNTAPSLTLAAAVRAYKEHPAWAQLKGLRAVEVTLVTELTALRDDPRVDWDGMALTFADGWSASVVRRQYSSERLAEVAPALFERLAVTKVKAAAAHVYVAREGSGDADGAHDLDAE